MVRAVLGRFSLSAPSAKPEQTGRRSITFSPRRRRHRDPARAPAGDGRYRGRGARRGLNRLQRGVLFRRGCSAPGPRVRPRSSSAIGGSRSRRPCCRKFGDDQAGSLASLVAYYAFFSLFPLLLVFMTILGFVLQGNPGAQRSIEHSVLGQFPVIGEQIKVHALTGHTFALVIGLVVAAARRARRHPGGAERVRSRLGGAVQGPARLPALTAAAASRCSRCSGRCSSSRRRCRVSSRGLGGPFVKVGAIALSLVLNFGLFLAAFRFLTSATIATRRLWLGVAFAAVFLEILQLVGGIYINHVVPARERRLLAVRARDRAARVAAPRRPADAVRGRDQRRASPAGCGRGA